MLEQSVAKLLLNLQEQVANFKEFLGLLQQERGRMVELDMPALDDITCNKQAIMQRLQGLEVLREQHMVLIAKELGVVVPKDLTISRIADISTEPTSSQLKMVQSTIRSLLISIREINGTNHRFAVASLRSINHSLGFFQRVKKQNKTYNVRGSVEIAGAAGGLLRANV